MSVKKTILAIGISLFSFVIFNACNPEEKEEETVPTSTITLYANGGTKSDGSAWNTKTYSAQYGSVITLDTAAALDLEREGYNFKGWSEDKSATKYTINRDFKDGAIINLYSSIALYAIWSQIAPVDYYVSATGDDSTGDGTEEKPYKTLSKAAEKITDYDKDYIFHISGEVTDSVTFKDEYLAFVLASSITIKGETGVEADSLKGNGSAILNIQTQVPVKIENITLTGGSGFELTTGKKSGGAIFISSGSNGNSTVSLKSVTITENSADNGGGIYNSRGTLILDSCTISNNSATSSGGAIYNDGGTVKITETTISGNISGTSGGGIWNASGAAGGKITFVSGSIENNRAPYAAGVYNSGELTLSGGSVSQNTATEYAGGIYNSGTFSLTSGSVKNNSVSGETGCGGGVVNEKTFELAGGEITGNSANQGGGVFNAAEGTVTMTDATITKNSALYGLGVYNAGIFNLNSASGKISENTTTEAETNGGGVYNTGVLTVDNGEISKNSVAGNGGGIANVGGNARLTLTYGRIEKNEAALGGGVFNETGTVIMTSTELENPTEAVFNRYATIDDNTATNLGGGVYIKSGSFIVKAGVLSAYGKRKANDTYYYSGNKAGAESDGMYSGCGNSWYKETDATITIYSNYVYNSITKVLSSDENTPTETFSDDDVVAGVKDWTEIEA